MTVIINREPLWDFEKAITKVHVHCFHPYPASMIPQVCARILDEFGTTSKLLFDPYCGSGTSLVEANLRGIKAIGTDVNPLARLIAKVKTTIISLETLDLYLKDFNDFMLSIRLGDKSINPTIPNFKNINYWFKKETQYWLSVIKEYIEEKIEDKDIQDFFKLAFSETVREVSLTRNSEFKLYRIIKKQIENFNPDVFSIMIKKIMRNRDGMEEYIRIKNNDAISKIYDFNTIYKIPTHILPPGTVDIIVTSPPYGDARTTVAYGQFSRLSNQWLGYEELNEVDKRSMGGMRRKKIEKFNFKPLDDAILKISEIDTMRAYDVVSFYEDYEKSINNVSEVVKKGGITVYVVGNRKVKGIEMPTNEVTREFFERNNFEHIKTITRAIPNKRMPRRNSPTNIRGITDTTMNYEYIVILRKK